VRSEGTLPHELGKGGVLDCGSLLPLDSDSPAMASSKFNRPHLHFNHDSLILLAKPWLLGAPAAAGCHSPEAATSGLRDTEREGDEIRAEAVSRTRERLSPRVVGEASTLLMFVI
jgi:hypothetical protein